MTSELSPILEITASLSSDTSYSIDAVLSSTYISKGTIQPSQTKQLYNGDYNIQSSLTEDIVLDTKDKVMTDDITINKIGITTTSNESGGYTLYIGKEN